MRYVPQLLTLIHNIDSFHASYHCSYQELFTRKGREEITDRKAREEVISSLRKMIKSWLDDTYPLMSEKERSNKANAMDMALIEATKENSIQNILEFSTIYRLSLIEMQFIKKVRLQNTILIRCQSIHYC